jgi:thiamine-monophosphate kinase
MREFDFIRLATQMFGKTRAEVLVGAGEDDCAILKIGDRNLLLTTDSLHERSDFPTGMLPSEMGHMAIAVNLSDLAGSGAEPHYFLYAISLREGVDEEYFKEILSGIKTLASKHKVDVVGGDVDFGDEIYISGFAVGFAERFVLQSGAKPGEKVWLTGITGKAQFALESLFSGKSRYEIPFIKNLLTPEPKVREGIEASSFASSMTDISDSLAVSLNLIARKSGARIEIYEDFLDLSELTEFVSYPKAIELFLYGGGDFELVYTAKEGRGIEIGRVKEGEGVWFFGERGKRRVEFRGYSHF